MPETTRERVVFVLGLMVVGVLCAIIVAGRRPLGSSARSTPSRTTTPPADSVLTTTPPATNPRSRTATGATAGSANELRFTAKADTWVSVRRAGSVLFEGTMVAHDTRTFTGPSFQVRFGAAANVSARLNGRPLRLPGGTYSATITRSGLGPRSA